MPAPPALPTTSSPTTPLYSSEEPTENCTSQPHLISTTPHLPTLYKCLQQPTTQSIPETIKFLTRPDIFTYNELIPFMHADSTRPYTRNLVFANNLFALMVLVWSPFRHSPVHDHSGSACYVKVIKGCITETIYHEEPENKEKRCLKEGDVGFISDDIGIHKMENEGNDWAISVHMYTPPFEVCKTFDFSEGCKVNIAKMVYDTVGGVKVKGQEC